MKNTGGFSKGKNVVVKNSIWILFFLLFCIFGRMENTYAATVRTPQLVSAEHIDQTKVKVTWKAVTQASGYIIYRKTEGQSWTRIGSTYNKNTVTFKDNSAKPGTVYYYTVKAFLKQGTGYLSSGIQNPGLRILTGISSPVLGTIQLSSSKEVKITWKKVENASGYRIFRKTNNGAWKVLTTIGNGNTQSYVDRTKKANAVYRYLVRSYARNGKEIIWNTYDKKWLTVIAGLATPALKSANHLGKNDVKLTWNSVANAKGYYVYKKENNKWVRKVFVTGLSWIDTDADETNNIYTVRAYAKNGTQNLFSGYVVNGISSAPLDAMYSGEGKVDYWVGDSRTVHIGSYLNIQSKCIALAGMGYSWYLSTAEPQVRHILQNNPTATIVLNFGVNDVGRPEYVDGYISRYRQLMADFPDAKIWIMSLNPADEKYTWGGQWGISYQVMANHIVNFNEKMKAAFPKNYIDTYSYLMRTGFDTLDGIHYTEGTTRKYYWYLLALI